MHLPFRLCLSVAMLALVACSPAPPAGEATPSNPPGNPVKAAVRDANADVGRLRTQGHDNIAREITGIEYPAYRALMEFSGLDAAQGGAAQADAALRALFALYERKVHGFESDLPKMLKMADGGDNIGYSGFAASFITGMLQGDAAVSVWEQQQRDGKLDGKFSQSSEGSSIEMEWSGSHSSSTSEFEGSLPGGLAGKIRTKVDIDTCPDASGKINVKFSSDSQVRSAANPGTGGAVKVTAELAKYLDDDARLIDDRIDSDVRVEQSAFGDGKGSYVDITTTLSTTRNETGTKVNRRSQAATDADVQAAEGVAKLGMMAAMTAVENAKKAWESGRCIELKATSDPGKRKGVKPSTGFEIVAAPRAKSDGGFPGGTVRATLTGGESLTRDGEKVRADAQYTYTAPAKKKEKASIAFESRSKRGVGKATLEFDTNDGAYRIKGGQNDFLANVVVCSLTEPFAIKSSVGLVMHMSGGESGGSWTLSGNAAGVAWSGGGSYALSPGEDDSGWLTAKGTSTIASPMGRFSDSVGPTFSVTRVDAACE